MQYILLSDCPLPATQHLQYNALTCTLMWTDLKQKAENYDHGKVFAGLWHDMIFWYEICLICDC